MRFAAYYKFSLLSCGTVKTDIVIPLQQCMSDFRSVFVGGIRLSASILSALVEADEGLEAVFCPSPEVAKGSHDDYVRLRPYAGDCAYHEYEDINASSTVAAIQQYEPDVLYVLGVSQILKAPLLDIPSEGCLGGHISLLPANRGCSPIIWAIANGLSQHGVTMIWLDEGIDTGDIAAQRSFQIQPHEHAGDVYEKVETLYVEMLETELLPSFHRGTFPRRSQPEESSNYWRRRGPVDGRIDWRMSARRIHNLVRALYHPYPGADAVYQEEKHKIWQTDIEIAAENRIPGEVLQIRGEDLLVKAGEDAVWLHDHELPVGNIEEGAFFPRCDPSCITSC